MMSNNYRAHLDGLLAKLEDENAHSRIFGYLVTRALLGRLSGEHQIDAAGRVLQVMGLEQLAGIEGFLHGADNLSDARVFAPHGPSFADSISCDRFFLMQAWPRVWCSNQVAEIRCIGSKHPSWHWCPPFHLRWGLLLTGLQMKVLYVHFCRPSLELSNCISQGASGERGYLYVRLMRKVYKLANSPCLPLFSINLLRALFVNIKDDALAFLAGVWIS